MAIKGFRWKLEVAKMAVYIYGPIFVWYMYNTDYVQKNIIYPEIKRTNMKLYKKLVPEEDDDES